MMSHPEIFLPHVEIPECVCSLNVLISAVFVVTFHGYSIQFPPKVIHTRIGLTSVVER